MSQCLIFCKYNEKIVEWFVLMKNKPFKHSFVLNKRTSESGKCAFVPAVNKAEHNQPSLNSRLRLCQVNVTQIFILYIRTNPVNVNYVAISFPTEVSQKWQI